MSHRSISDKLRDPTYWLEQSAHWFAGDVVGQILGFTIYTITDSGLWAGVAAVSAAALGATIRELVQNIGDDDNDVIDSIIDWIFVVLGGLRSAYPFWVLV